MKFLNCTRTIGLIAGMLLGMVSAQVSALTIAKVPLEQAAKTKPNILIMLDNSGSMKTPLYGNNGLGNTRTNKYDPSVAYLGMFDSSKNYFYDDTTTSPLKFDTSAIGAGKKAYPSGVVDQSETTAFVESTCSLTANPSAKCWSGNFLNWLVTRRIDATRTVLVGGKVENRNGYAFGAYGSSTAKQFKIVGNNEPTDNAPGSKGPFKARYDKSSKVSPSNDNDLFEVNTTVQSGAIKSAYKPYAKLKNAASGKSYNIALVVQTEPKGLLQDVASTMRLGLSFYYFDPNINNIYTGNAANGGSLNFNIPLNPFIKKPTDTSLPLGQQGYRTLSGKMGTNIIDLVDAVEHMPLIWGTTPLAENLWEMIRYFSQESPAYRAQDFTAGKSTSDDPYYVNGKLQSCIQSRVLVFTDGAPVKDANIPAAVFDYDLDGDPTSGKDNLDDVAYWAYCDTNKASCKSSSPGAKAANPNRDLRSDIPGDQYLLVDAIRFANGTINSVMQDTADNAGGSAYAAPDGATLKNALNALFTNAATVSASSSVASNSTSLNTSSLIYQAQYDGKDWSGKLRALKINQATGAIASTQWDTDTTFPLPPTGSREIFTYNAAGIDFKFNAMSAVQKASLQLPSETTDAEAKKRIAYILGDQSDEQVFNTSGGLVSGIFRARKKLLGDIVHSSPWFVGAENFGYVTLPSTEGSSYASFLTTKATRTQMLYVGANDGMLHAFNAKTGSELFAYVPSELIPKLVKLTDPAYGKSLAHDYFVDGAQRAGDVYYGGTWHTVLVGSTGAGGRSVYALDVTDPDNFDETNVLWEFNDSNDVDMGYTLAEPTIARMANGKWAAIVPNGYNSSGDKAVLFIIDIETGMQIAKLDTKAGNSTTPNGLSSAIPVDTDGDHNVDAIYAGDLLGNLWKFDVSGATAGSWKIAYGTSSTPEPLFVAKDSSGTRQPITAKPQAGLHPVNGTMIYFGTGQYFAVNDQIVGSSPQVQSYYAIRDNFATSVTSTPVARTDLQQQSILVESSAGYRLTSNNTVNYASQKGWYMNLQPPSPTAAQGERVVSASLLRNNRIVFVTLIPNSIACGSGGSSWLMEMDAVSGARLATPAFDLSADGKFDTSDNVAFFDTNGDGTIDGSDRKYVVAGKKLKGGASNTPTVVQDGDKEYKYTSGSKANAANNAIMDVTTESVTNGAGRESWRQIKIN